MTSHDVVAIARRVLGTRKVGHAGTLDPMATGVLILGFNNGTRLLGDITQWQGAEITDFQLLQCDRAIQSVASDARAAQR